MKRIILLLITLTMSIAIIACAPTTAETTTQVTTTPDTQALTTDGISTTTEALTSATPSTTEIESTEATTTEDVSTEQVINFFSINDFHAGAYSDIENLSQIGAYLKYQLDNKDNTVVLTNGDIFQGSALSNYYHGLPIVDVLNYVGIDGFNLGNHEFDWGIDQILNYRDGLTEDGEMTYPILAANIVYTDTQEPLENTLPYITKTINGVKVGIIGVIGDVIDSIAASRVENIEFKDAVETVSNYAEILRVDESCDIVVVYAHEGSYIDTAIANLTGDHYVDAVFNGHTHADEAGSIFRTGGGYLYYAQASNATDSLFTKISLTYDTETNMVVDGSTRTYTIYDLYGYSDSSIEQIIADYSSDSIYRDYVDEVLADVANTYSRGAMAPWGASVIRDYVGVDLGVVNSGGFRVTMYPGELTMGELIEIYPFDNFIKTCEMTGTELQAFYDDLINSSYDVVFDDGIYYIGEVLYVNNEALVPEKIYKIGAVDYIFDKDTYGFLEGSNIEYTDNLMRDLLAEDLLNTVGLFNPADGSHLVMTNYFVPNLQSRYFKSLFV